MAQEAQVKFTADLTEIMGKLNALENKFREIPKEAKVAETKTTQSLNGIGQSAGNTFASIGAGVAAAFSTAAVLGFAKAAVSAFAEAEKGDQRLLVALKGNIAAFEKLDKQATALKNKLGIDDDVIKSAQTFLSVQGRTTAQIERTIQAAKELSAITGDSLQASIEKLDQTFEGSIGKLGKLDSRFKELTKEQLANGAAVDLIIQKYDGFSDKTLDNVSTRIDKVKTFFGNLTEDIGSGFAALIAQVGVAGELVTAFVKRVFNLKDENKEAGQDAGLAYFEGVEAAIQGANRKNFESVADSLIKEAEKGVNAIDAQIAKIQDRMLKSTDPAEQSALQSAIESLVKTNLAGEQDRVDKVMQIIESERDRKKSIFSEQQVEEDKRTAEALKKKQESNNKFQKFFDDLVDYNERIINIDYKNTLQGLKDKEKAEKEFQDFFDSALTDAEKEVNKDYADRIKGLREFEAQRRLIIQESFALASELLSGIQELQSNSFDSEQDQLNQRAESVNAYYDAEAAALEKKNERGSISDRVYAAQREALDLRRKKADEELAKSQKKLQREQAISNKVFALFNIGLSTAQAIIAALAMAPPNVPLSIFAGVTGAIQLAVAAAAPIPGFKDGTKFLDDPKAKRGIDTILMYGNRGERIVTAEDNQKHWDKYEAIEAGNWHKYVEKEAHAQLLMQARKEHKLKEKETFAGSISNALAAAAQSNPTIDFKRVLDKGIYIKNWGELKDVLMDLQPVKRNPW